MGLAFLNVEPLFCLYQPIGLKEGERFSSLNSVEESFCVVTCSQTQFGFEDESLFVCYHNEFLGRKGDNKLRVLEGGGQYQRFLDLSCVNVEFKFLSSSFGLVEEVFGSHRIKILYELKVG
jgi:hypothetical protein